VLHVTRRAPHGAVLVARVAMVVWIFRFVQCPQKGQRDGMSSREACIPKGLARGR
jgi:hypothetical protein